VTKLTELPTGRPTNFNRSLASAEGAVSSIELAKEADGTDIRYVSGIGRCRHYPEGVLKDARPALVSAQMMCMTNQEIGNYYNGSDATVMIVDQ
jgi:hypothetical protein